MLLITVDAIRVDGERCIPERLAGSGVIPPQRTSFQIILSKMPFPVFLKIEKRMSRCDIKFLTLLLFQKGKVDNAVVKCQCMIFS